MATQIDRTALHALRQTLVGQILTPSDSAYYAGQELYNAMIKGRPALIVQSADVQDVVRAVDFGRDLGLEIVVRGGGHGVAGYATADDGLVIDLRRMNTVAVDPHARTATVGGGATTGDLDQATGKYGLATTGARASTVGVCGITLAGGNGWLDRKFGLACDNLVSAELVTADGAVVRASEDENAELFWGLHGGGGNFGVVTSLTLRLHPLASVTAILGMVQSGREPSLTM